jgi:hypothetical protein
MGPDATKAAKLIVSPDAQEFVDRLYERGWQSEVILARLSRHWPERVRTRPQPAE